MLRFEYIQRIYKIEIVKSEIPFDSPFKFNMKYPVTLRLLDRNHKKISNYSAIVGINILKYPSYNENEGISIEFHEESKISNTDGEITGKIIMWPSKFGIYAINFYCEGAVSDPIEFQTEFNVAKISIIQQPYYNFTLLNKTNQTEIREKYLRSGDFLPIVNFMLLL